MMYAPALSLTSVATLIVILDYVTGATVSLTLKNKQQLYHPL